MVCATAGAGTGVNVAFGIGTRIPQSRGKHFSKFSAVGGLQIRKMKKVYLFKRSVLSLPWLEDEILFTKNKKIPG